MNKDKFTPGPWKITSINNDQILIGTKDFDVCMVDIGEYLEEDEANAQLIARAPDLLQENRELRAEVAILKEIAVHETLYRDNYRKLREAIKEVQKFIAGEL